MPNWFKNARQEKTQETHQLGQSFRIGAINFVRKGKCYAVVSSLSLVVCSAEKLGRKQFF